MYKQIFGTNVEASFHNVPSLIFLCENVTVINDFNLSFSAK